MMPPDRLLAQLRAQGFRLWLDADRLGVQPASKLTPDLRAAITSHRADLLTSLAEEQHPPSPGPDQPPQDPRLPCLCPDAVCWRCCNRPCELCGHPTGSAFIRTCTLCGLRLPAVSAG
jgi:hypothetical protein